MRRYLVLGHKGQLGSDFCRKFDSEGRDYQGYDLDEIDISNYTQLNKLIESYKPSFILNCAAYNLVDKAEQDFENAYKANALGVKNIAHSAHEHGAFVVHYSTDYVFDGRKVEPYIEEDIPNPLNKYAETKLAGEKLIAENIENFLLFRLSWVYGTGNQNFIYKLKQWAEKNSVLKIANDEVSVPTSTKTIVDVTLASINAGLSGLYHLTNSGYASRYNWAVEILRLLDIAREIEPVSKDIFNLPALRPVFTAMNNKKISAELNLSIPNWEEALRDYLLISV